MLQLMLYAVCLHDKGVDCAFCSCTGGFWWKQVSRSGEASRERVSLQSSLQSQMSSATRPPAGSHLRVKQGLGLVLHHHGQRLPSSRSFDLDNLLCVREQRVAPTPVTFF